MTSSLTTRKSHNLEEQYADFFQGLNKIEDYFDRVEEVIPQLSDEQLTLLYHYLDTIGKNSWRAQCAVIAEAQNRARHGSAAVEAMAKEFGVSRGQAFKDAKIYNLLLAGGQNWAISEKTYYQIAIEAPDPHAALSHAEERLMSLGKYTTREFQRYVKSVKGDIPETEVDAFNYFQMPVYRNADYLDFFRSLPCCVTRNAGPNEAHHIETAGRGVKCSDYLVIPLSPEIHRELTAVGGGKDLLTKKYHIDPLRVAARIMMEYLDKFA